MATVFCRAFALWCISLPHSSSINSFRLPGIFGGRTSHMPSMGAKSTIRGYSDVQRGDRARCSLTERFRSKQPASPPTVPSPHGASGKTCCAGQLGMREPSFPFQSERVSTSTDLPRTAWDRLYATRCRMQPILGDSLLSSLLHFQSIFLLEQPTNSWNKRTIPRRNTSWKQHLHDGVIKFSPSVSKPASRFWPFDGVYARMLHRTLLWFIQERHRFNDNE